ncbi:MAG: PfaD family polyunsaturated fatty acid/polyketide biosynthesis protein [Candidatus Sericytochromatia bacterium]|nr:PfaD family polyunsaturated fatty acid/polyketide biosynthesis protein [Candidatus Sericytochromatia bacterium]
MSPLTTEPPRTAIAAWRQGAGTVLETEGEWTLGLRSLGRSMVLLERNGGACLGMGGSLLSERQGDGDAPVLGIIPALRPAQLGAPDFLRDHGLKYPYVAGAMANGIGSEAIVEAMGRHGMLGFFGAGGLSLPRVEAAIDRIQAALGEAPYGFNLLHAPNEPDHERDTVALYLQRGIRLVEAAAYLDLTLPLVRYRTAGIRLGEDGRPHAPNRVIAKVSRVEVASKFLAPPPEGMLTKLVEEGHLSAEQAEWARALPVADDLTAEADSGGHTDNRPALSLLPTMLALRDALAKQYGYARRPRVGLAGGIATPESVAAAFALGADYVVTGSINQACVESGSSDAVRAMLAQAQQADVAMAPAGDMFEMGVKVQVLKRGTMFPMRATRLYELYRSHDSLEALPEEVRKSLEKDYFRATLESIWEETRQYFTTRDPSQIARAERDPRHRMALVFRWYLGHASRWANAGEPTRKLDYQVWCGPAMGAFNAWTAGTALAEPAARGVVRVAHNLLVGACALKRWELLRCQASGAALQLPVGLPVAPVLSDLALEQALA